MAEIDISMSAELVWRGYRGSPVKMSVSSLSQVRQVSAGSNHTALLTADGRVLTCGSNQVD